MPCQVFFEKRRKSSIKAAKKTNNVTHCFFKKQMLGALSNLSRGRFGQAACLTIFLLECGKHKNSATMEEAYIPDELPEAQRLLIFRKYLEFLRTFKAPLNQEDQILVRKAFEIAAEAHKQQWRKDGAPYITHPIEVARICVEEIGLGPTSAACALLHDVVEDTDFDLEKVRATFPDAVNTNPPNTPPSSKIANIVDGLTKLRLPKDENAIATNQQANIAKVLQAMIDDVRVVLIKLADRLHNLRTIDAQPSHKQLKIVAETESVYTPLAHQLGLYRVKSEFQDLCLKVTNRAEYDEIARKLNETKAARVAYINDFVEPIIDALSEVNAQFEVFGRPKSIHSIWNKIKTKKVTFENIYDLFAIRILFDADSLKAEKVIAWNTYALITELYRPIPDRMKDWISHPKSNGYEALHTTVLNKDGRYVEIQIRSHRMNDIAERGFAAHWKYKGAVAFRGKEDVFQKFLDELRINLETDAAVLDAIDSSVLISEAVVVFTPKGETKALRKGATALDFAFAVHTDVGCHCQVVEVNGVMQPFSYVLQTGDQVRVITNKSVRPSEDWLKIVTSNKARNRIRAALNETRRQLAAEGKETLGRKLQNTFGVGVEENVEMLTRYFKCTDRIDFLCRIAEGTIDLKELKKNFKTDGLYLVLAQKNTPTTPPPAPPVPRSKPLSDQAIIINNDLDTPYSYAMAKCCNPIPGDPIFAYLTTNDGVKIHRMACPNATNMREFNGHRILGAEWTASVSGPFTTDLVITGIDRGRGVIRELSECLESLNIDVRSFSILGEDGFFEGRYSIRVRNHNELAYVILSLKKFDYVQNVTRATD
jgi:GTP diphosphokinase / guanosine-3',5'-bis(diphosphate) 3'-diphosphatase